jgi:hypothetical protein
VRAARRFGQEIILVGREVDMRRELGRTRHRWSVALCRPPARSRVE